MLIITLMASVFEKNRQRCLDAGRAGFLANPLCLDELAEVLERYIFESAEDIK